MNFLDETHDINLKSWVASANIEDNGFPIQNLPFAIFRRADGEATEPFRPGTAIGDQILDLAALADTAPWDGLAGEALAACTENSLNPLMSLSRAHWTALRLELSRALRQGSALQNQLEPMLIPQSAAQFALPA